MKNTIKGNDHLSTSYTVPTVCSYSLPLTCYAGLFETNDISSRAAYRKLFTVYTIGKNHQTWEQEM